MIRSLILVALVLSLTGAGCMRRGPQYVVREEAPYPLPLDPKCRMACPQLPKLEADAPDGSAAADTLGNQQPEIARMHESCDIEHRKACADAIDALERAGVVQTVPKG